MTETVPEGVTYDMRWLVASRPGAGNRWPETIPDTFTLHCYICGSKFVRDRKPLVNDTANYQDDHLAECKYFCSSSCKGKYAARQRHGPKYYRFCACCLERIEVSKKTRISGVGMKKWKRNQHSSRCYCSNSCKMKIVRRLERRRGDTEREEKIAAQACKGGIATQLQLSHNKVYSENFEKPFASEWEREVADAIYDAGFDVIPSPGMLETDIGPGPYFPDLFIKEHDLYLDPKAKPWKTERQMRKIDELTSNGTKIWVIWDQNNRDKVIDSLLTLLSQDDFPTYTEIP